MTMPFFGAGQRVTGAKLMVLANGINAINARLDVPSNNIADPTSRTTSSAVYTTTLAPANVLGVSFTAPASGIISVEWGCRLANSVSGNFTSASFQVSTGGVVGSGTPFLVASDDRAVTTDGNIFEGQSRQSRVTGLTPGATYNAAMYHRTTAGVATFVARDISVIPLLA